MNTLFKALGDATRREILRQLRRKDMSAGDIAAQFDMSKASISYHLDLLKKANLVVATKKGQFVYYALNTTEIDEIITWLYNIKDQKKTSRR